MSSLHSFFPASCGWNADSGVWCRAGAQSYEWEALCWAWQSNTIEGAWALDVLGATVVTLDCPHLYETEIHLYLVQGSCPLGGGELTAEWNLNSHLSGCHWARNLGAIPNVIGSASVHSVESTVHNSMDWGLDGWRTVRDVWVLRQVDTQWTGQDKLSPGARSWDWKVRERSVARGWFSSTAWRAQSASFPGRRGESNHTRVRFYEETSADENLLIVKMPWKLYLEDSAHSQLATVICWMK